jgi:hypothetical protein
VVLDPAFPAYDANQRIPTTLGSAEQEPLVTLFTAHGNVTRVGGIAHAADGDCGGCSLSDANHDRPPK